MAKITITYHDESQTVWEIPNMISHKLAREFYGRFGDNVEIIDKPCYRVWIRYIGDANFTKIQSRDAAGTRAECQAWINRVVPGLRGWMIPAEVEIRAE